MSDQPPEKPTADVQISVIETESDFPQVFNCISKCFGTQTQDGFWTALNPKWETPKGKAAGTARMIQRFHSTTKNVDGDPNTVHLKATVPDPKDPSNRVVAGVAIWAQWSMVKGRGDVPSTDINSAMDLEDIIPGDESEQRFVRQAFACFMSERVKTVEAKAKTDSPSTFSLDLCVVDPDFQRRGIAVRLVEWGLEEARRRGDLESTTEGSAMGRLVYARLGFHPVKEVVYHVDPEFEHRSLPPNLFMRTGEVS